MVIRAGRLQAHSLVPALHPAHRILCGKNKVLIHPGILPPDPFGILINALERFDSPKLPYAPDAVRPFVNFHQ